MRIVLVAKSSPEPSGVGRYARDLEAGLRSLGHTVEVVRPISLLPRRFTARLKQITGWDLEAFFNNYPVRVRWPRGADVYHLTSQNLATLLLFAPPPGRAVVTVHDIIPYLVRGDPLLDTFRSRFEEWFYMLSLRGVRRAQTLLAVSEYTRRTLVEALGLDGGRIQVVFPSISLERFHPAPVPDEFLARYGLNRETRYILSVGTNDPRKNQPGLVAAFARLRRECPDVRLILVGGQYFARERERVRALIAENDLGEAVFFYQNVPEEDLLFFYNLAAVFVFPSFYEGFGLPVAEALACGTPVVCANTSSLPEIAGNASVLIDPTSIEEIAQAINQICGNSEFSAFLQHEGFKQVQHLNEMARIEKIIGFYQNG
jgi:glycosyltransferase involved in cell wall biosynthesis